MKKSSSLLFLQLILSISSFGQDEYRIIGENFNSYEGKELFNGIVLIAKNGEIVFSRSMGYASFEEKIELSKDTPMPISSITKSFTAMSIMILVERQLLQVDDPVKKYLKNFPYDNITIRHLLNHTAGFKRMYKNDLLTTQEVVTFVSNKRPKLSFEPGEKFQYSNLGYSLLAAVVEEISDKPFSTFLDDEIFKKLDMENTFLLTTEKITIQWQVHMMKKINSKNGI